MRTISIPRSRILDLMRAQCNLFNTTFNPERRRLGNSILRQRLKGPSVASYYPPRVNVIKELKKAYPDWIVEDEAEDKRLDGIRLRKLRGKGAPKKRTKEESKALSKRSKIDPNAKAVGRNPKAVVGRSSR